MKNKYFLLKIITRLPFKHKTSLNCCDNYLTNIKSVLEYNKLKISHIR